MSLRNLFGVEALEICFNNYGPMLLCETRHRVTNQAHLGEGINPVVYG